MFGRQLFVELQIAIALASLMCKIEATIVGTVDLKLMKDKHLEDEALKKLASESLNTSTLAEKFPGRACHRPCSLGEPPRICYFTWTLENYHAMGS